MKHLIIYAHPNPLSFCNALMQEIKRHYSQACCEVLFSDLYASDFNPVLSPADLAGSKGLDAAIMTEQSKIAQACCITFVYPLWWGGMPAILKGYIDRVFTEGFAYRVREEGVEGLLGDKKVIVICTTGQSHESLSAAGTLEAIRSTDRSIFGFCGMELVHHQFFFEVPRISSNERCEMLAKAKQIAINFAGNEENRHYY